MTGTVRQEREGTVAVLVIDAPPVNALGSAVRAGLAGALAAALADDAVQAVVIRSDGRSFSAGADIREFGHPAVAGVPSLSVLCNLIEAAPKPVVAVVQGAALGGGMELALAAHLRVAGPGARFGLPEVTLGLLPGAGGTQRMPRLVGAGAALDLMLGGAPVSAEAARQMGLVDAVVPEALVAQAVALAAGMGAEGKPPRRTRDRWDGMADAAAYQSAVAAARARAAGRLPAPKRIVDCVEAALLLPFDQGLEFERTAFADLLASPESAGLRKAFLAERRAASFPEAKAVPRPVLEVGVAGLGRTGVALAADLAGAGFAVTVVATGDDGLKAGLGRVDGALERAANAGRMTSGARDAAWDRVLPGESIAALNGCDLVIEASPDDDDMKLAVLADLGRWLKPGAVIATTVTWLDPAELAGVSGRSDDLLGLSLGLPGQGSRLAEVSVTAAAAPEAVATVVAVMRQLGQLVVRTVASEGGIGERVMAALRTACDQLVEAGAAPNAVDAAFRHFGFAAGPYEALDAARYAALAAHRRRLGLQGGGLSGGADICDLLARAGRLVRSSGGDHRHAGGSGSEDPRVVSLLAVRRSARGIVPRQIGQDEILLCGLAAAANEGARLLGEGVAMRPGDIDAALVAGYGFPRWEAGPMARAAARGLPALRADLQRFATAAPEFWSEAPLIGELLREGRGLADLDAP